jgi:hypothetical protein
MSRTLMITRWLSVSKIRLVIMNDVRIKEINKIGVVL